MADLTETQSAQSVKIIGSDSNGVETSPLGFGQSIMSESLPVAIASDQGPLVDTIQSGSLILLNDTVQIDTDGRSDVSVSISGTWSGIIQFEAETVTGTWYNINGVSRAGGAIVAQTNTNGNYIFPVGSTKSFRVRRSNAISGTAVIDMRASSGGPTVNFVYTTSASNFPVAASQSGTWTVQPGNTANTTPWLVTLNQGGNSAIITNTIPSIADYGQVVRPVIQKKYTYSSNVTALSPANSATDIFTITGSNTATIKIKKIYISLVNTTAGAYTINLIKRSTANTGGTSAVLTNVPFDSLNSAATATVRSYTANPTLGTEVGTIKSYRIRGSTGSNGQNLVDPIIDFFGQDLNQEITLRGDNEVLCINQNATTIAGDSYHISIEWTEE